MAMPADMMDLESNDRGRDDTGSNGPSAEQLQAERDEAIRRAEAAERASLQDRERIDRWLEGAHNSRQTEQRAESSPMPDPAEDPAAFAKWNADQTRRLQEETESRLEAERKRTDQRIEQERRGAELWSDFREEFPEHAKRADLARMAFNAVIKEGAPGSDADLLKKVASRMNDLAGTDIGKAPVNRTSVPSGDIPSNPKKRSSAQTEEVGSMRDAIFKEKSRFGLL